MAATNATPFRKLLVANRGEIALRVLRAARAAGYRTVAVCSSVDRDALHAREADQAVVLGGPLPAESYLDVEAVLRAALATGADAVHPGYGFLAEDAGFARACRSAGLVFVGPPAEAIAAMGDKAAAKRLVIAAGVPCIPGWHGEDQSDATLRVEAERLGYPLLVKAAAGGGGRGLRLVAGPAELADALRSARSEAQGAFGSSALILERAVADARHVEIQVLADRHGHVVHLGERDCSLQRRHQKIVEEAPSPAVGPGLRDAMGAAAVAAARAVAYEGAGTVEFLLDRDGRFWFLEMNTRLQVEHAVTEAVTGLDLVDLQLRVAAGEPLPFAQADVRLAGHAIEARLCAEEPRRGFLPAGGRVEAWRAPAGARVEHALEPGGEIPPYYDSMVAKVICAGATREEARRKLAAALRELVLLGVETNQAFLLRCLEHPAFAAGAATTGFVAERAEELLAPDAATAARARALAALVLWTTSPSGPAGPASSIAPRLPVSLRVVVDGARSEVTLAPLGGGRHAVAADGRTFELELLEAGAGTLRFACDGVIERAAFVRTPHALLLGYRGEAHRVDDRTHAAPERRREAAADGRIRSPMNGRVVALHAKVGDPVRRGHPVLTLEAMKMEHVQVAPVAGTVAAIHVGVGDQVAASHLMAEIAAAAPAEAAAAGPGKTGDDR
jgi:geranyl-CoA carboxylase alpha subunit